MIIKTKAKLVRHYGKSRLTIYRWIESGMPTENGEGFCTEKIDQWLRERDGILPSEPTGSDDDKSKQYWETQAKKYQAQERKLKLQIKRGEFLSADEVRKVAFDTARQVRDSILNIPSRLAAILAAESDENKVRAILIKELRESLMELSTGKI